MKIMIIGSGGREHALVWAVQHSKKVKEVVAVPGNAGISQLARCVSVSAEDIPGLITLARQEQPDLVIVGPEVPLSLGLVDGLAKAGIPAFGPIAAAARLEGSKAFAKDFMAKYHIPTARYTVCRDLTSALFTLKEYGIPVVIKADGLAAGKGVTVATTQEQAEAAIYSIMQEKIFGEAGSQVVIEEYLAGEEASVLAFCDGKTIVPMVAAQDHKRVFDADQGPNTGGMGAYAPAPVVTAELSRIIQHEVLEKVMQGMLQEGTPYKGILYAGLMITDQGPKVIEFNCRFGDPETQVILPLLESDLVEIVLACIQGTLTPEQVQWKKGAAVCVVIAAPGYPGNYPKGMSIQGLEAAAALPGVGVWHAGTAQKNGQFVTNGGRVLNVVGQDQDLATAVKRVYQAVEKIQFTGAHYRRDIAHRALQG